MGLFARFRPPLPVLAVAHRLIHAAADGILCRLRRDVGVRFKSATLIELQPDRAEIDQPHGVAYALWALHSMQPVGDSATQRPSATFGRYASRPVGISHILSCESLCGLDYKHMAA